MTLLLIDNYDSFTWNVFDLIATTTGTPPEVIRNDHPGPLQLERYEGIVLSPGPGHPGNSGDFGRCPEIVARADLPVLGICLGHQGLCLGNGGRVAHAPRPCHGEVDLVHHDGTDILAGLPSPFRAVRYHSLAVTDLPDGFNAIAHTEDGVVMAVAATDRPHWGVQFHPESACSEHGAAIVRNFMRLAAVHNAKAKRAPQIVIDRFSSATDPAALAEVLGADGAAALWLDTSLPSAESRFSFLADTTGPAFEWLSYAVNGRALTIASADGITTQHSIDLFDYLDQKLRARAVPVPKDLPFEFNLGYVGYLGYELKALTDGDASHTAPNPDAQLCFVDRLIAYDHTNGDYWLLALARSSIEHEDARNWIRQMRIRITSQIAAPTALPPHLPATGPIDFRHSRSDYLGLIRKCLAHIRDGRSYEVCLTNMASVPCPQPGREVYRRLRSASPVPFGAYLRFGDLEILCASPERFLSASSTGALESKPIKGTRPRYSDPQRDQIQVADLAANPKDRAENLMIVDLVRNDLSRCCYPGSVHVAKLFDVETYSHVHQLVSTIRGQLAHDKTVIDAIRSTYPGGSMTGAPKIRTMQIIDGLEAGPRGIYSGTIGYLALSGAAELNIVIRTMTLRDGTARFGVGGAIIALSDIDDEYAETLVKARTCLKALGLDDIEANAFETTS
jgi:para-aminobenzoate synthetase